MNADETSDTSNQPPRKKKSKRRKLYDLHTWVGFHLAVIMVMVLFTGTFATISNELDWLTQHDMRVTPDGSKVSWQEMIEAVEAHDPTATISSIVDMKGDHFAYRATVLDENAVQKFIHVNQWTGEVTGETPYFTIQRFFRDLHRYLFLPKSIGLTLVCSMAIILSISLYTGLKTSRNWRTLMTRIRFSKGARTAIGDAHKVAGLWSIWFFVLIIATGLWYYAEYLGKDFEPGRPAELENMSEITSDVITNPSANEIIRIAETAYPDLKIQGINFSTFQNSPIIVAGSAGNPIVRQRANAVMIDPVTMEALYVKRSADLAAVQWLNQIADPLHFGSFGGLPVKLIWFVFGLFMTGLSVSGVWLTWRRLQSRGASRMQLAVLPVIVIGLLFGSFSFSVSKTSFFAGQNPIPYALFNTGLFLAAGALLCGIWLIRRFRSGRVLTFKNGMISCLVITMTGGAAHATLVQNPYRSVSELNLGTMQEGPIQAEIHLSLSTEDNPTGDARLVIYGETGRLNLNKMTVRLLKNGEVLETEGKEIEKRFRFLTKVQLAFLELPPEHLPEATHIEAAFEMNSGNSYSINWKLSENR